MTDSRRQKRDCFNLLQFRPRRRKRCRIGVGPRPAGDIPGGRGLADPALALALRNEIHAVAGLDHQGEVSAHPRPPARDDDLVVDEVEAGADARGVAADEGVAVPEHPREDQADDGHRVHRRSPMSQD